MLKSGPYLRDQRPIVKIPILKVIYLFWVIVHSVRPESSFGNRNGIFLILVPFYITRAINLRLLSSSG